MTICFKKCLYHHKFDYDCVVIYAFNWVLGPNKQTKTSIFLLLLFLLSSVTDQ